MYKNKMLLFTVQRSVSIFRPQTVPHTPATNKNILRVQMIAAMLVGLLICAATPDAFAERRPFEAHMPIVAIDPGHGGNDTGAKGPSGVLEKALTLNLARLIAQQLAADFRIVLTRNDDYGLDHASRTAAANHAMADIFISLHIGSSFIHDINRSAVYFYQPFQGTALATEIKIQQPSDSGEPVARWDRIQAKYRVASEKMANRLQAGLAAVWQPQDVAVQGIPILVLEGADMPAVTVEIGNLSNANAEKQLTDSRFLTRIAEVIVTAITDFLAEKPK